MPSREIVVAAFPHPGHLFPAVELSNKLASSNYQTTLLFPSSTPLSSLSLHPLIRVEPYQLSDSISFGHDSFEESIVGLMDRCYGGCNDSSRPLCAVVDEMVGWLVDVIYEKYGIPCVSLFTSSATSAALEHAMGAGVALEPGMAVVVPGLPAEMAVTQSLLTSRRGPPGGGGPSGRKGAPRRGGPRRSIAATGKSVGLLFNTCEELERPFIDYLRKEAGKPVWGVGPLVRSRTDDVSGNDVIEWLGSKPQGSVIYVSFGSLVNPSEEELAELAAGLKKSKRSFIWVDRSGDADLAERVGPEGLIIRGWAPQQAILDHPSMGAYVCHCGWNSTLEALMSGVPMLTWPVRGDQFLNAKLATGLLKVGIPLKEADEAVGRDDVAQGIERLMGDVDIKKRADEVKSMFSGGSPASSSQSLDQFLQFVNEYSQQM